MRRAMTVAAACMMVAACSKGPDGGGGDTGPDLGGRSAAGIAFSYAY